MLFKFKLWLRQVFPDKANSSPVFMCNFFLVLQIAGSGRDAQIIPIALSRPSAVAATGPNWMSGV